MSQNITDQFIAALHQAEASGDPNPLAALFAADSECTNLAKEAPETGVDGARKFWGDYLKSFQQVKSEFFNVIKADDHAVLEWTSTGTLPGGKPIKYRGVSVLQYAGDKVKRFHTYYDSAAFVAAPATAEPAAPGAANTSARQGTPEPAKGSGGSSFTAVEPNTAG